MTVLLHHDTEADVTLLLEGTYPFIQGGVSSWVHQMIQGLSEYTFALVFIGGDPAHYSGMKYTLPDNVVHLETHYFVDATRPKSKKLKTCSGNAKAFQQMKCLHKDMRSHDMPTGDALASVINLVGNDKDGISQNDFLCSEEAWSFISDQYQEHCTAPSFVDYFWTIRTIHSPVFMLDQVARNIPKSKFYHTISTGYAGFLGALIALRQQSPLLISEHGIYTKERKIDLAQAEWVKEFSDAFSGGVDVEVNYIRQLWMRFFEGIGHMSYQAATDIVSLYEGNRQRQIQDGASAEKTAVIPNGIKISRFLEARENRPDETPLIAGLVGRVVPIKDIKTFIRAIHKVCHHLPTAEGWIIGPDNEDPEYSADCHALVKSMGLEDKVRFLGMQQVDQMFPQMGVNVLTSISEALPLVMLEGFACGVPSVATNVGSCHELMYGSGEADEALGAAGEVVSIANPDATADAIIALLTDREHWQKAQQAGIARVETFYTEEIMYGAYRSLYQKLSKS